MLRPDGSPITAANVGNVLATRDLMADMRAADPFRQAKGKPFSKADRGRFSQALDQVLSAVRRPRQRQNPKTRPTENYTRQDARSHPPPRR